MNIDTYTDLAEALHLKPQSVKRNADRNGYSYGINDKLPSEVVVEIIEQYKNPAPRRTDKTIKAAKDLYRQIDNSTTLNVQVNNLINRQDNDKQTDKTLTERRTKADKAEQTKTTNLSIPVWIIAIVLAPALIWQMEHYAAVVNDLSRLSELSTLSYVFSWMFAFSVTGTAIVMTTVKGNRDYLIGFAVVETLANIIYCQPDTLLKWGTTILISGAMAFTILSYSEIFAKAFQRQ